MDRSPDSPPTPQADSGFGTLVVPGDAARGEPQSAVHVLTLVRADQAKRWQAGDYVLVEAYLGRLPGISEDPEAVLDLVYSEVLLRERHGQVPTLEEYLARFPQHQAALSQLWEVHRGLQVGTVAGPARADTAAALCNPTDQGPSAPGSLLDMPTETRPSGLPPFDETLALGPGCVAPASGAPRNIPGYEVLGELGRGGMGVVLHGRDPNLGRDLAIKVLQDVHQENAATVHRFVEEARIGGRLQHPGVVPVHALGRFPDGRPFFTMKLVQGRTLAHLLQERADPTQDRVRFLNIFEHVCQTLAYAHSKGVIHRDLKPANVMVGAFGEVQVMDWGLAKVLADKSGDGHLAKFPGLQPAAKSPPMKAPDQTDASGPGSQAGMVLGTPAYMAPEQARGEVDRLDERADVFGLGAILGEILTGQPPYTAAESWQAYAKAAAGDLTEAMNRLARCGAEEELVDLARQCLAAEQADRPRDAGAVTRAVTAYLADVQARLRTAELERAAAQGKAGEERKRRKVTLALAAAVVAIVVVAAGSALWLQRQAAQRQAEVADQEAQLRRGVDAAMDKAAGLGQQARWAEARAVLEQVKTQVGEAGPDDLRARVERARADLDLVDRLDSARLRAATWATDDFDYPAAQRAYTKAFADAGLGRPGDDAGVVAARVRGSAVRAQLVAALDDWAHVSRDGPRRVWLLGVARRADPDPWRDRFRNAAVWRDRKALWRLAQEAPVDNLSPQLLAVLGNVLLRAGVDPVPLLTAAQQRHPGDFWLNFDLANANHEARRWGAAVGYYQAALAIRPKAAAVYNNLGNALHHVGRWDDAIVALRKALAYDPRLTYARNNLGIVLTDQKRPDQAIALFRQTLAHDPRNVAAHAGLGHAFLEKRSLTKAVAHFRRALELDPRDAHTLTGLGMALEKQGRPDEALPCYQKAVVLDRHGSRAFSRLGNLLAQKRRLDEAIAAHRKAVEIDPAVAESHNNLGIVLSQRGRLDEAFAEYRQAIALNPKLAHAYSNMGNNLRLKGWLDEALVAYRQAIALAPRNADIFTGLGLVLADRGQVDQAIAAHRKALAINPRDAKAHVNLGSTLRQKGLRKEALAEYRQALALDPNLAQAHYNLANSVGENGQTEEALAEYRKALTCDPSYAAPYYGIGLIRDRQGRLDEALAAYRQAIVRDPNLAQAHCNVGSVLQRQGAFAESLAAYRRGHQLGTRRQDWHYPSADWVKAAERLVQLDRRLPVVLARQTRPASVAEGLEFARVCRYKQLYRAAAWLYAEAFSTDSKGTGERYRAACCAAQAGAGKGKDAGKADEAERRLWRKQALAWLRAELTGWVKQLETSGPEERAEVRQAMGHWQREPALAGLRDADSLGKLPEEERDGWRKLWAEVGALRDRAREMK
jgi:tetratricopeptide (TPR) repeat protein